MSLGRALLLSVALHALVLATSLPQRSLPQQGRQLPLTARLVEVPIQSVLMEVPQAVKRRSTPRIATPAKQAPLASELVEALAPEPAVVEQLVAEPAIVERAAITEPSSAPTFDPGIVAKYRLEIISAARQFKRYPPLARDNGWEGKAEVRVSFEGAHQPAISVSRSSGYAVLDRQAVETLSKALAPLPPMLLGRSFELDFPVVFSLDE